MITPGVAIILRPPLWVGVCDHASAAAVAGADKIYLLISNGPNGAQHGINLIEAVKRSGGRPHIVRHGMFGDSRSRINTHHEQVAAVLAESGLPVTTLRPTFFMQNTLAGAQTVASAGQLYWAMDEGSGSVAYDSSGNGYDLTVSHGIWSSCQ